MKIKKPLILKLIFIILYLNPIIAQVYEPIIAKNGMVVCTEPIATSIGINILKKGGNAMDAAIATAFVLAVTYQSCGNIGGGGFLTYYDNKTQEVSTIDFRITAPLSSTKDMYVKEFEAEDYSMFNTIEAAGIPGTVSGMWMAHEKYGTIDWAKLIEPSVKIAREGFPMHQRLYDEIKNEKEYLLKYPSTIEVYLKPDTSLYEVGEVFKQPDLANTLERIQTNGKEGFYSGETAHLIRQFIEKHDGFITVKDLESYKAVERKPVTGSYKGYDIYSMAPPSSGGIILIESLNILENYDVKTLGHNSADYIHLLSSIYKIVYSDRENHVGDPDFVNDIPVGQLISKDYASEKVKELNKNKKIRHLYNNPVHDKEKRETTHFSVIDKEGNAVALTYTLDGDFGSYGIVEGAGFFLNNELQAFDFHQQSIDKGSPNLIEPQKRPLSSMAPTIIMKDGKVKYIIGTPGGTAIPSTLIQIILNLIEFDMNIAEAISAKRLFAWWWSDDIFIEKGGITIDTKLLLEKIGYNVDLTDWRICNAMCIEVDNQKKLYYGVADPRSINGIAIGY